ncbi:MAG TPA: hypothetical protein VGC30_06645, partial [Dokdonella sp.]
MRLALTFGRYGDRWAYPALAVLTTLLLFGALGAPLSRLDVPYTYWGDAIDKLAQIQNVAETGWLFDNPRLGYPFGYDRLDFPRFDSLNYAIMGPLAALTGAPGIAMNLYFVAGFYLIGFAAFYAFRRLGMDTAPALVCALLYAFLPYHVIRNVFHLTNGAYFLVPLGVLVLVRLARGAFDPDVDDGKRRLLGASIVAALLPLQMPYNGAFFAVLCIASGAIAVARRPRASTLLPPLVLLAATAFAFAVEQLPVTWHKWHAGANASTAARSAVDAETYALRLNQVLLPTPRHRIGAFAHVKRAFDRDMNVLDTEANNQYIGLFGDFGLLVLLWGLARAVAGRRADAADSTMLEDSVRIAAMLALVVLLLAISTGVGSLVSFLVTTKIRAYNRVLPFLAFTALLGGGWMLQITARRLGGRWPRGALIAVVGVAAAFDLTWPHPFRARESAVADFDADHAWFEQVERLLPTGAAVFQLPAVWYPEHPPVEAMTDYEEFKPFLATRSLKFSYGNSRGRAGYMWSSVVEKLAAADMITQLHAMGYSALLIDGRAYADAALHDLLAGFSTALPEAPLASADRRWWLVRLDSCCGTPTVQISRQDAPTVFTYAADGSPIRFGSGSLGGLYRVGDWWNIEDWGTWSANAGAGLRMRLVPTPTGPLTLKLRARALVGPKVPMRHVRIEANGQLVGETNYDVDHPEQTLSLELPAGLVGEDGLLEIDFAALPPTSPVAA